jgi:hypothetical protein
VPRSITWVRNIFKATYRCVNGATDVVSGVDADWSKSVRRQHKHDSNVYKNTNRQIYERGDMIEGVCDML